MIKIALTNLGKYNEGYLVYTWLDLPCSDEELQKAKDEIGINEMYEEWFITDFEADIPGFKVEECKEFPLGFTSPIWEYDKRENVGLIAQKPKLGLCCKNRLRVQKSQSGDC